MLVRGSTIGVVVVATFGVARGSVCLVGSTEVRWVHVDRAASLRKGTPRSGGCRARC